MTDVPIVLEHLNHYYGEGELRRQVLYDVTCDIRAGEIVILTGPSGSGKTTLLTLVGALRSTQEGTLRVLGRELRGANEKALASVRKRIGYIFQAHNLLEALTASQNVQMSLEVDREASVDLELRAAETLQAVGLGDRIDARPSHLSGGQRQRVAIARALARRPEIVLADEPTASLDRDTGRSIVELLERLARKDGVTVILVTHDSRILDVADRILTLEDGRLSSLMNAVASDAQHRLRLLIQDIRRGELVERVSALDEQAFGELLHEVTEETRRLLDVVELLQGDAFESMLEQLVRAFTAKAIELLDSEGASLYLLDEASGELWCFGPCEHGQAREIRIPIGSGIVGGVARSGAIRNIPDLAAEPSFDPAVDAHAWPDARRLLAVPVSDSSTRVFAVLVVARGDGSQPFDTADERRLGELTGSLGLVLESWWRMSCSCRAAGIARTPPCCSPWRPGPS